MKNTFYKLSIILLVSFFFIKCENNDEKEILKETNATPLTEQQNPIFSTQVFNIKNKQFGYDILMNGQPYIHQPHIPAISGNNGFTSKNKAQIAGDFIIKKLNNNIMPPTITLKELDSLGVLN